MNCFDKTRRLLKKSDYNYVFEKAKKIATPEFTVLYRTNTLGYARLGLIIAKRSVSKAHDRNRMKRLLREAFRTTQLPAVDVIFMARHGVAEIENKVIVSKLSKIWNKLIA